MQLTTEELIERGLPAYMNELGNWQMTDMVHSIGHRLAKVAGIWTAVPKTNDNNTNFDTWLRGLVTNFQSSLGPVNNDGSRTIGREGLAIHLYFDANGNVNKANMIGLSLLQLLVSKYPTASPEALQKAVTVTYEFVQKPALSLTSLSPDLNFDGVNLTNNTLVDGIAYDTHPNLPQNISWVLDIANFDDRMTGKTSHLHFLKSATKTDLSITRANGTKELIENVNPSFVNSWIIGETDDLELLANVYDEVNNIVWVDFSKNVLECNLMLSLDHNLKAEGSQGKAISLK